MLDPICQKIVLQIVTRLLFVLICSFCAEEQERSFVWTLSMEADAEQSPSH